MTTFAELPLSSALQQKLAAAQFTQLMPIQERAIQPALEGKDVIGTAQTGTGKALVLLPTRELAMQVHEQYEQLRSKRLPNAVLIVGGLSENVQIQALRKGARLIVATPGRLQDLISRRLVDLSQIKILVLD